MAEEEQLTSAYNEAEFQISRLHNIWLKCQLRREQGDLVSWKWALDSAEVELWADALRLNDERTEDDEKKKTIIQILNDVNENISKAEKENSNAKIYAALKTKEKTLRQLQELAGKGAKFKSLWDDGM